MWHGYSRKGSAGVRHETEGEACSSGSECMGASSHANEEGDGGEDYVVRPPLKVLVKEEYLEDQEVTEGESWTDQVTVEVDVILDVVAEDVVEEPTGWLLDDDDVIEDAAESEATDVVNVSELSDTDKVGLLRPHAIAKVRKLTHVRCDLEPEWSLQLLEVAAPRLEELHIQYVRRPHLGVLLRFRRLWRLEVWHYGDDLLRQPFVFPPRATKAATSGGLECLSCCLPLETTKSLLSAHSRTLSDVVLHVGTPGDKPWPQNCSGLEQLLQGCGLPGPRLRRLVLHRDWRRRMHRPTDCFGQRTALQALFPGVDIHCTHCQALILQPGMPDLTTHNLPNCNY